MDRQGENTKIKSRLARLGIEPRKSRGQNFLANPVIADEILAFSGVERSSVVLEVGPGLGALTERLVFLGCEFYALEVEEGFVKLLLEEFPKLRPEQIICADALEIDPAAIGSGLGVKREFELVSNVPYSISSELVLWVIKNRAAFVSASLLLQKEFAERLGAEPGGRDYGSLTVLRSVFFDAELGPVVAGSEFYPETEVESQVIKLTRRKVPRVELEDTEYFEKVVRAAFSKRRKTLLNSLGASGVMGSKEEVGELLERCGIDGKRRAETLSVEEFGRIASLSSS